MTNGDNRGKQNQTVKLQSKEIKTPKGLVFLSRFVAHEHQAKFGLGHRLIAEISDAKHEGRLTVKGSENQALAEDNPGDWPGEADENQAGDDGHTKHPGHDFHGRHPMSE